MTVQSVADTFGAKPRWIDVGNGYLLTIPAPKGMKWTFAHVHTIAFHSPSRMDIERRAIHEMTYGLEPCSASECRMCLRASDPFSGSSAGWHSFS